MEAPPILVFFAVKEEAMEFHRLLKNRPRTRILFSGMGRKNAEVAINEALANFRPWLVLTCGFAGGLNPRLSKGTVVFSDPGDADIESRLLAAGAIGAKFHCAEKVVSTAAEKRALHESTGADVVEMESGVISAIAAHRGVPCTTVRVILDEAHENLPMDFNQFLTSDYRMNYLKLMRQLLAKPGKIRELKAFQSGMKAAASALAEVLIRVIPA